jgi:PIN domain nuclease of toxin-antitoxin system
VVFYSQISLWEIQIKYQLGKLPLADEPAVVLPREVAKYDFTHLDLTDAAIFGLSRLPPIHGDPFDRILIIQAKLTGSTLVTPDLPFFQYSVDVIWQMNAQPTSFVSRIFK